MSYETGAAHTRIQNLKVENRIACEAAKTATVSKAEQRSMQRVFFPNADAKASEGPEEAADRSLSDFQRDQISGAGRRMSTDAPPDWLGAFDDPIALPDGGTLRTLHDAGRYATALPKAAQERAEWQSPICSAPMARMSTVRILLTSILGAAPFHFREERGD